jgi:hypothetical protein
MPTFITIGSTMSVPISVACSRSVASIVSRSFQGAISTVSATVSGTPLLSIILRGCSGWPSLWAGAALLSRT